MEVSELCALCNKQNDQMLMLACVHDPCIKCAATAYADQVHIKHQSPNIYICQICEEETSLDSTTITELNSLAKSVIKSPTRAPKSPHKNVSVGHHSAAPQISTSSQFRRRDNVSPKKVTYYCKEHSQEQISYYCFSCWANICPQCAIHGAHKDHEVKLIKKAISQVKGQYMEIISKIGVSQSTMSKYKDGYLRLMKQTNQRCTRQKNLVSRQFQLLKNSLVIKQKEIQKELDEINKQNVQILTSALQAINLNHQQINKVKKSIEIILKKDQVLILEDYKRITEPDEKVVALNKATETVTGDTLILNTEFLQQQVKEQIDAISKLKPNIKKDEIQQQIQIKPSQLNS